MTLKRVVLTAVVVSLLLPAISFAQVTAADYERAFGRPAPRVKGLRLQINSQHTGTFAESYFGEVAFRSTPQ